MLMPMQTRSFHLSHGLVTEPARYSGRVLRAPDIRHDRNLVGNDLIHLQSSAQTKS